MSEKFWEHYTDPIPAPLLDALKQRRLVAFIGAGVSQRCYSKTRTPLSGWSGLLLDLIRWSTRGGLLDEETANELYDLLQREEFLIVAQECRDRLGDEYLGKFVGDVFNPDGVVPARVHELLAAIPFSGYITTNYDNLLERAYGRVHNRQLRLLFPESAAAFVRSGNRFPALLKLHGDLDDPVSIVLGHRDYLRLIWMPQYADLLRSILTEYTLLFVGYGLGDLDILLRLDQLVHDGVRFKHFMLSQRGRRNAVEKKRLLIDRQVELIEYVDYFGLHNHVDTFLNGLLVESKNAELLCRVRVDLRARIHIHYDPRDEIDGLFVWNYLFREGAITLSEEPQKSQWEHLKTHLPEGLSAIDHLVFLITPQSLQALEIMETIQTSLQVAEAANVLVVFLAIGYDARPEALARVAPSSTVFLLPESFSEVDLGPFRGYLAEDIKGGHRQP